MYSIDEFFVGVKGSVDELVRVGRSIRHTVYKHTGVPVRVAIGPTKTLAKLASIGAKKNVEFEGVCHLGVYSAE